MNRYKFECNKITDRPEHNTTFECWEQVTLQSCDNFMAIFTYIWHHDGNSLRVSTYHQNGQHNQIRKLGTKNKPFAGGWCHVAQLKPVSPIVGSWTLKFKQLRLNVAHQMNKMTTCLTYQLNKLKIGKHANASDWPAGSAWTEPMRLNQPTLISGRGLLSDHLKRRIRWSAGVGKTEPISW